jgi:ParB family chromosome partitioning protein
MTSMAKKGAGIQFVIPPEGVARAGSDDRLGDEAEDTAGSIQPKGGVASIAMAVTLGRDVRQQFEAQKAKLAEYEKAGTPPIEIDPRRVRVSRYANRHEASFSTPEFLAFKVDLRESGGNLVPVKVRPILEAYPGEPEFELIYGHRRHRGCLEEALPLRALVQSVDDKKLFVDMDRENRGRASLSPWEQGVMYQKALNDKLFPNQKVLAAELGLSQAVISKAIAIGNLPQEVVACFSAPLVLSYRTGQMLVEAVGSDEAAVLHRAAQIFESTPKPEDAVALGLLLNGDKPATSTQKQRATPLFMGKKRVGKVTIGKDGAMAIEMTLSAVEPTRRDRVMEAIKAVIEAGSHDG